MSGQSISTLGALRAILDAEGWGGRIGLDYGSDDEAVLVIREGEQFTFDISDYRDEFTPSKRAVRRAQQERASAIPAPVPENASGQVRRALERAARKGGAA